MMLQWPEAPQNHSENLNKYEVYCSLLSFEIDVDILFISHTHIIGFAALQTCKLSTNHYENMPMRYAAILKPVQ